MVPAGHSVDPVRWHGELDALLGRVAAVPDPCPATRCTSCHVRGAAARPIPVATLVTGGREAAGGAAHLSAREAAADTSMATYTGHWPSGRRSFRKQRTVNPLMVPACLSQTGQHITIGVHGDGDIGVPQRPADVLGRDPAARTAVA
jgi:hypothetical protein